MQATWRSLEGKIDAQRYEETRVFLGIQEREARWWRDASVLYFQTFSQLPVPPDYEKPEHDLQYHEAINKKYVPGI
jgi:alpha-glucuronidase